MHLLQYGLVHNYNICIMHFKKNDGNRKDGMNLVGAINRNSFPYLNRSYCNNMFWACLFIAYLVNINFGIRTNGNIFRKLVIRQHIVLLKIVKNWILWKRFPVDGYISCGLKWFKLIHKRATDKHVQFKAKTLLKRERESAHLVYSVCSGMNKLC